MVGILTMDNANIIIESTRDKEKRTRKCFSSNILQFMGLKMKRKLEKGKDAAAFKKKVDQNENEEPEILVSVSEIKDSLIEEVSKPTVKISHLCEFLSALPTPTKRKSVPIPPAQMYRKRKCSKRKLLNSENSPPKNSGGGFEAVFGNGKKGRCGRYRPKLEKIPEIVMMTDSKFPVKF